jgi:hypothetical protein
LTRIVFDISGHGLGHLSQIAPLIALLRQRRPDAEIIIRSQHAPAVISAIAGEPFNTASAPPDPGLVMQSPVRVDAAKTLAAHAALHEDFAATVAREADKLAALKADVLISDIGYTGLAAAARAGIAAYALCSLHWEEMIRAYLPDTAMTRKIREEMLASYNSARAFFIAGPRRRLAGLRNARRIAPLVRGAGRNLSGTIRRDLGAGNSIKLGVITFGGLAGTPARVRLPDDPAWRWIVPDTMPLAGGGRFAVRRSALGRVDMLDLIASCDLAVTKTGYGTFMECAASATPCLFLPRPDWPEAPDLETWMRVHGFGAPVSAGLLASGQWLATAARLAKRPARPGMFTGAKQAADVILTEMG